MPSMHGTGERVKNMSKKADYDYRRAHGLCVTCGKQPAEAGRTRCAVCSAAQRLYTDATRQRRRNQGLCTYCGKKPAVPGHLMCPECNDKARLSTKRSQLKRREHDERVD